MTTMDDTSIIKNEGHRVRYNTFSVEEGNKLISNNIESKDKQWHLYDNYMSRISSSNLFKITLAILCFIMLPNIHNTTKSNPIKRVNKDHYIPTLLSIRDKETGVLLSALDNPLYKLLKNKKTAFDVSRNNDVFIPNLLHIDTSTKEDSNNVIIINWETNLVNDNDILSLHCPEKDDFIEALYVNQMDNQWNYREMSFWKVVLPIIHHSSCHFQLWREMGDELKLVSVSDSIVLKDEVRGIHLAYTNSASELVVNFGTSNHPDGSIPMIAYSTSKGDWTIETGTTTTYSAADLCSAPANLIEAGHFMNPGYLHSVLIKSLIPDTLYYYKLYTNATSWSPTYSFTSAPPSAQDLLDKSDYSIQFIAYGDQGCTASGWAGLYNTTSTLISKEPNIRLITHVGDLSYAVGAGHVWDAWLQMLQPVMTSIPYMISIGNHEYDYQLHTDKDPSGLHDGYHPSWGNYANDSNGECGVPTIQRFTMPTTGNKAFWYSYDLGFIHFIVISAEHDITIGSTQYQWLLHDLLNVDKNLTPWIVLQCHRPIYHAEYFPVENSVSNHLKSNLEELLYQYKVDLYIAGHWHSYQRTCPGLYHEQCFKDGGTMHVTIGTAGAVLTDFDLYPQHWVDFFIQKNGYGKVNVTRTSLTWEFVLEHKDDSDASSSEVIDRIVLNK